MQLLHWSDQVASQVVVQKKKEGKRKVESFSLNIRSRI